MWPNTDKVQLERCDQIQKWSTRKMWSNTDKGQLEKCQLERCDQIQIKVN